MSNTSPTPRYALLIGVGDYSAYDKSTSQTGAPSDLDGAEQDVASMYALSIALGILPANIHVLLSPPKGEDGATALRDALAHASPGKIGPATRSAILAECKWLADSLAATSDGAGAPAALISYSGHGDFVDGHLALCPTDVRSTGAGADLENAVAYSELGAMFSNESKQNITAVLDCCHAAAAVAKSRGRSSLTGRARTATGPIATIADRTIAASSVGGQSEQSVFDGVAHGALTWALKVVTDQWKLQRFSGETELSLSYGKLIEYVNRLLAALDFEQRATFEGAESLSSLPFFHRGSDHRDPLSKTPDRDRYGGQLEPDHAANYTVYTMTVKNAQSVTLLTAYAISVWVDATFGTKKYSKGKEYLEVGSSSQGYTWSDLVGGTIGATQVAFAKSTGTWGASDPWSSSVELGASSRVWISGSAPGGACFYQSGPSPACGSAVICEGTDTAPSFGWAIEASTTPSDGTMVVTLAGSNAFTTTAPTCNDCNWYQPGEATKTPAPV